MDKHNFSTRIIDEISTITGSQSYASKDKLPSVNVVNMVIIDSLSWNRASQNKRIKFWCPSMSMYDGYMQQWDKLLGMPTPIAGGYNGLLGNVSAFKHGDNIWSRTIGPIHQDSSSTRRRPLKNGRYVDDDVFRSTQTEWNSPFVFTSTEGETSLFNFDYTIINTTNIGGLY